MNNTCVYLHFRKDDGLCFYVGMGTPKRPNDFNNRSEYWKRVKAKHGIIVEVIYENLSFTEAAEVERAYIAHFSQSPLAKLVNRTSGGERTMGVKNTKEACLKKSESALRLNADPDFKKLKLERMAMLRGPESNKKRSESHRARLNDPELYKKHMVTFSKNRASLETAQKSAYTAEACAKRGESVRKYLTHPDTRHVGLMKTALMNASRWKRPYTRLTKEYFERKGDTS